MKRLFSLFIAFILLCETIVGGCPQNVKAEAIGNYISYTLGTTAAGKFTEDTNKQYYKFTLSTSGCINITGFAYMSYIDVGIYDINANNVFEKRLYCNSTTQIITIDEDEYLTSGTYYMRLYNNSETDSYNFNIKFTSSNETYLETNGGSNNSFTTANEVKTDGTVYNAQLAWNDEKDFWKVKLDKSGSIKFDSTFFNISSVDWNIYDDKGNELLDETEYADSVTENIVINEKIYLASGTYYIVISKRNENYGRYQFTLNFTSSNETYTETNGGSNNTLSTASVMQLNTLYTGQIALNDEKDFYKLTLVRDKTITLKFNSSDAESLNVYIYNSDGSKELFSKTAYCDDTTKQIIFSEEQDLSAGTYYIVIQRRWTSGVYTVKAETEDGGNTPTPIPTSAATLPAIATPSPTPTVKPTATPSPTPTVKPTPSPMATPIPTPTVKPTASPKATPYNKMSNSKIYAKSKVNKHIGDEEFDIVQEIDGGGDVTYISSNKKVVTVNRDGLVSIKGCGKATITIIVDETNEYYANEKNVKVTILPGKVSKFKVKALSGGRVNCTWKKQKYNNVKCQIQASTNSKFKAAMSSKKYPELKKGKWMGKGLKKKKTVYFRIREVAKIGGKTYTGAWSSVKKVKIK